MESIYTKENGNIVISYDRKRFRDKTITFVAIGVVLLGLLGLYCVLFERNIAYIATAFFFFGIFPIVFLLLFIMRNVENANKEIEQNIIFPAIESIISNDINSFGSEIKELARRYVIFDNEKVVERIVFLILSNGKEIFYSISEIAEYNEQIVVLEIDTKYKIKEK